MLSTKFSRLKIDHLIKIIGISQPEVRQMQVIKKAKQLCRFALVTKLKLCAGIVLKSPVPAGWN
ncbi:hypothetical protein PFLA_a3783 [Pseudoalteromonas flavipulchra NCIMB 2033 = ATCC BAA-314]|nr:hypothetical protein [Pseudoalteromonas flavipulchra NCIMB 2033 = ATCC BAA-314]